MTSPGLAGRRAFPIQRSSRGEYVLVYPTDLVERIRNPIVAGFFTSRGRARYPEVKFALISWGQLRVSAHHATSSKKLLPRPLSPVKRLSLGASFISMDGAGPTFSRCRYSSIRIGLGSSSRNQRNKRHRPNAIRTPRCGRRPRRASAQESTTCPPQVTV